MKTIKRYFLSIHYGGAESLVKPNDCKFKKIKRGLSSIFWIC